MDDQIIRDLRVLLERIAPAVEKIVVLQEMRLKGIVADHQLARDSAAKEEAFRKTVASGQEEVLKVMKRSIPPPEPWRQDPEQG